MSLADDLQKLEQLRSSGSLSESEFEQAKKRLLSSPPDERRFASDDQEKRNFVSDVLEDEGDRSLGNAANRYVSFQIIMSIIGFVIFLIVLFTVFLPTACNRSHFSGFPGGSFERVEWKHGP